MAPLLVVPSEVSVRIPPIRLSFSQMLTSSAALGLVGVGAFFLIRRRKNNAADNAAGPPGQPLMAGNQYPNQPPPGPPGGHNQMYSGVPSMYIPPPGVAPGVAPMAAGYYAPPDNQGVPKAPLSPMSTAPSQFTPTDPSNYNPSVMGAAVPPSSTTPPAHAQHTPPPPNFGGYAQPGQQGYPQQHGVAELPTGRSDGELRELA